MNEQNLIDKHLQNRTGISYMLYPLSLLYLLGHRIKQSIDIKRQYKAPCFVMSIGNLTGGGTGKTPMTIAIAKRLQRMGYKLALSHRGYKGNYEKSVKIVRASEGLVDSASDLGDEAYLLAQSLPELPLAVGRDRALAIRTILKQYPDTQIIILDDAFQNKQIFHDLDIVLISSEQGLGNGFVLPAGYLREPLTALKSHHVCVAVSKTGAKLNESLKHRIIARTENCHEAAFVVRGFFNHYGEAIIPAELESARLVLCSAIGNPVSFEKLVRGKGLSFLKHFKFPDHYAYHDPKQLVDFVKRERVEYIVCTQKDLIKLVSQADLRKKLVSLEIGLEFVGNLFWDQLLECLPAH